MAAVSVDKSNHSAPSVFGDRRVITAQVDIASNGDTFATGLASIDVAVATSSTTGAVGLTYSGGTITFVTGGAINNVQVMAIGQA